jgi:outer membrane biosynthesis protein TonB
VRANAHDEGDTLVRRFLTIAVSLSMVLGLAAAGRLIAQEPAKTEAKAAEAPKVEDKKAETPAPAPAEAPKAEEKKADAPAPAAKPEEKKADAPAPAPDAKKADAPAAPAKADAKKAEAEAPLPTIPPEVEAKLEAARHAVAEAIVAAQDAGLVETNVTPPPILDILITGRALDQRELKARKGVSPEVFGAFFTGYAALEGITPQTDVRIVQPSKGLTDWYGQRANILNRHIDAVRKAKADAAPKKEEAKPAAAPATPAPEPKKEEAKPAPAPEPKKEEAKPAPAAPEPAKEEAKPAPTEEPKKEEAKPADAPKDAPKS